MKLGEIGVQVRANLWHKPSASLIGTCCVAGTITENQAPTRVKSARGKREGVHYDKTWNVAFVRQSWSECPGSGVQLVTCLQHFKNKDEYHLSEALGDRNPTDILIRTPTLGSGIG